MVKRVLTACPPWDPKVVPWQVRSTLRRLARSSASKNSGKLLVELRVQEAFSSTSSQLPQSLNMLNQAICFV